MPSTLYLSPSPAMLWKGSNLPPPDHTGLSLVVYYNENSTPNITRESHQFFRTKQQIQEYNIRQHVNGFEFVQFDANGENVACIDKRGNLYVLRLKLNRYSLIKRIGIQATAMQFSSIRKSELLIALKNHSIQCYNIENNSLEAVLHGKLHKDSPVISLSFHPTDPSLCLSCSRDRVLVWDILTVKKLKTLASKLSNLTFAKYSPNGNFIVTCLGNDLYLWNAKSCEFVQKLSIHKALLPNLHQIGNGNCKDFLTHFEISPNEKYLLAGGRTPYLFLWNFENLSLLKIFSLEQSPYNNSMCSIKIKFLSDCSSLISESPYLPQLVLIELKDVRTDILDFDIDSQWTLVTAACSDGSVRIYDLDAVFCNNTKLLQMDQKNARQADSEFDRSYQQTFLTSVQYEYPSKISKDMSEEQQEILRRTAPASTSRTFPKNSVQNMNWTSPFLVRSSKKLRNDRKDGEEEHQVVLDMNSLKQFLLSYGEYPNKYRKLIWRYILCLPENRVAYDVLEAKGNHPAQNDIHRRYPVKNTLIFTKLQKIASQLTYLCPVFGVIDYLPEVIFPLLKVYKDNMIVVLEIILTFFQNWGKQWFEFYPSGPVSLLKVLDNMVADYDPVLAEYLRQLPNVGPELYMWLFIKNIFTDVLDTSEWMKLFDHIFTMPPLFFYYTVIAYVSYFRESIMAMSKKEDFENVNPCDINRLIKLAYSIQKHFENRISISNTTHPLHESIIAMIDLYSIFVPLPESGCQYPIPTTKYPQQAIDHQIALHTRLLKQEQDLLLSRQNALNFQKAHDIAQSGREWGQEQRAQIESHERLMKDFWRRERDLIEEKIQINEITNEERFKQIESLEIEREKWMEEQRAIREREIHALQEHMEKTIEREIMQFKYLIKEANREKKEVNNRSEDTQRIDKAEQEKNQKVDGSPLQELAAQKHEEQIIQDEQLTKEFDQGSEKLANREELETQALDVKLNSLDNQEKQQYSNDRQEKQQEKQITQELQKIVEKEKKKHKKRMKKEPERKRQKKESIRECVQHIEKEPAKNLNDDNFNQNSYLTEDDSKLEKKSEANIENGNSLESTRSNVRFTPEMAENVVHPRRQTLSSKNTEVGQVKKNLRKKLRTLTSTEVQTASSPKKDKRKRTDAIRRSIIEQRKMLSRAEETMDRITHLTEDIASRVSTGSSQLSLGLNYRQITISPREEVKQTTTKQQIDVSTQVEEASSNQKTNPILEEKSNKKASQINIQDKFEEFMAKKRKLKEKTSSSYSNERERPHVPKQDFISTFEQEKTAPPSQSEVNFTEHCQQSNEVRPEQKKLRSISSEQKDTTNDGNNIIFEKSSSERTSPETSTIISSNGMRTSTTNSKTIIEAPNIAQDSSPLNLKQGEEESISYYSVASMSSITDIFHEHGVKSDEPSTDDISVGETTITSQTFQKNINDTSSIESDSSYSFSFLSSTNSDIEDDQHSLSSVGSASEIEESLILLANKTTRNDRITSTDLRKRVDDSVSPISTPSPRFLISISSDDESSDSLDAKRFTGVGDKSKMLLMPSLSNENNSGKSRSVKSRDTGNESDASTPSVLSSVPSILSLSPSSFLSESNASPRTETTYTTTTTTGS